MIKLKEIASQLGYLKENLPISLQQLEKEIEEIAKEDVKLSERKPGIYRLKFSYVRREFDDIKWNKITDYLQHLDYEIIDANNSYEANYDREEPPEWVPTIKFK